jgi:hypothetical protein
MKEIDEQMKRLRAQIIRATNELPRLEKKRAARLALLKERAKYVSSQEILELIYQSSGRKASLATIKRWADQGLLGEVINEREHFATLVHKQGNKRFLFRKEAVYPFLLSKGLLRPRFDILDQVIVHAEPSHRGVVVAVFLCEDSFLYTIQREGSQETMMIKEVQLRRLDDTAT